MEELIQARVFFSIVFYSSSRVMFFFFFNFFGGGILEISIKRTSDYTIVNNFIDHF